jgi:hypothetical protein
MRFSWAWLSVLSCSHIARDWSTGEPAVPLSSEVVELRVQVESTHQILKVHNDLVRAADSRLFWQGLVLKLSIFVDIFLGLLALWLWLSRPLSSYESPPQEPAVTHKSKEGCRKADRSDSQSSTERASSPLGPTRASDLK